jgi:hypothetical protein
MLRQRSNAWGLACAAVTLALLSLYSARTCGLNTRDKHTRTGAADTSPRRSPSAGQDQETAAYTGISKITDPGKRLEALKKFAADFPGSSRMGTVQDQIFDTLIRHFSEREEEIGAQARQMIEAALEKRAVPSRTKTQRKSFKP